jgi:serine phosphatase RsbU (regulator of sigma subunit)/ligand-binding sensor domain-containing protein
MCRLLSCILFVFLNVFCCYFSYAQELGSPFIRNYTPKMYNAHVQNWDVLQDKRGIVYFGNGDGLMEYDGVNFRLLELPNKQNVRSMAIDNNGIVYIGSTSHFGYLKTDSTGKTIFVDLVEKLDKKDRDFTDVTATIITKDAVFFRTSKKLFRVDKNQKIRVWNTDKNFGSSFVLQDKFFIRRAGTGLLMLENDSLVAAKSSATFRRFFTGAYIPNDAKDEIYFPAQKATTTVEDYAGFLAYSPFKPYKDTTYLRKMPTEADSFMIKNSIVSITKLKNNNLVFAASDAGAIMMSPNGKLLQEINQTKTGLQNDAIRKMWTDRQNATWFAMNKGISRLELQNPISFWSEANSGLKGVPEAIIRHKGILYIATHTGIFYIDKQNNIARIPPFAEQCWSFCNFVTPENDTLLLAVTSFGVYEIRNFKGVATPFTMKGNRVAETVFEMYQSKKNPNRLLIGTSSSFVTMRYENGKWLEDDAVKGLKDNIRGIAEDKEGNIWLGSFRDGIYKIVPNENENDFANPKSITNYTEKDGVPSLKNVLVYHFDDKLVFGTEKGLIIFDKASNKFLPFIGTLPKQLYDGSRDIFSFQQDKQGNLWASGLFNKSGEIAFCEKLPNGSYNYITKPFKSIPEMMVLAFYVENDSICWIGGSEGLYRFDRKQMTSTENKFATLIRKVKIDQDSTIFFGAFPQEITSVIGKVWSYTSNTQPEYMKLQIPYKYNDITIEFAASSFIDESNTLYSYFMEGYDENWSTWSKLTQKEYTNLREGKYNFKVKAKDILGNESEMASYEFRILPPYYRTWWAYLMYVCVSGLVIWQIVKYNTARLKAQNIKLEKIVIERTAEIETKKQEVEKSYENVQLLNEIGQKLTASLDLDKVLNTLYENVNELMDATVFGIGLYDKTEQKINYRLAIAKGVRYLPYTREMTDKNQFPVWCIENKADIFMADVFVEYKKYIADYKMLDTVILEDGTFEEVAYSMLYTPIFSNTYEVIGIITVQSYKKNAYTNYHLSMLKSLAVYTAIALENADTFHEIETQKQEIDSINEELSVTLQASDKQRHELFEKNADIIASINYAKRIQNAMMPTQETLDKILGKDNYFVLFKPRDIVSGDFYWIREVNNKILVVVADCTGHGVPGAFVSMVGNSTLNEITKRGLVDTHLILSKLHKEISLFFNQNINLKTNITEQGSDNLKVQDGMDISIIAIDKETKIVEYAGAKNPLYYVMNGKMHEIKADKYSIGGHQAENEAERIFAKHNLPTEKTLQGLEDLVRFTIYLATDGFQDQFGGENNKKFMTKRFRELLFSISHLPMAEQQQILNATITEWIGEGEQTDDITVMGVRI